MAIARYNKERKNRHETESLITLVKDISRGDIQLPRFQRDWRWPVENIKSLLETIIDDGTIGLIQLLQVGGDFVLPYRSVEGLPAPEGANPSRLIMDGQQRLTALSQTCNSASPVAVASGKGIQYRLFYFDYMKACSTDAPTIDCIIDVKVDKNGRPAKGQPDYTTEESQFRNGIFPLNRIFEADSWQDAHEAFWDHAEGSERDQMKSRCMDFVRHIPPRFLDCEVTVTTLLRNHTIESVCSSYEKLNTKGVPLNTFDLLIAFFAAEGIDLRDEWALTRQTLRSGSIGLLEELEPKQFMQAALFMSNIAHGKSLDAQVSSLIRFEPAIYQSFRGQTVKGFVDAEKFLAHRSVLTRRMAPSAIVMTTLALALATLGPLAETVDGKSKIERWFWCVMFADAYYGNDKLILSDLPELVAWVQGRREEEPRTMQRGKFIDSDIFTTSQKAPASRAIFALILGRVAYDFGTGNKIEMHTFIDGNFDIHHIFPVKWCKDHGIPERLYNSVINKTPMSPTTNRRIGGRAPSEYLKIIQDTLKCSSHAVDDYVKSHGIDPVALRANDFYAFFEARRKWLSEEVVRSATGIEVVIANPADPEATEGGIEWPESATMYLSSRIADVFVREEDGNIVIVAGSRMSEKESATLYAAAKATRQELLEKELVLPAVDGKHLLLQDLPVTSISAAASTFTGNTSKGKWLDRDGATVIS